MGAGIVVSHWDVDGVVAAALIVRHLGYDFLLATPVSLASVFNQALTYAPSHVVVCDVSPSLQAQGRLLRSALDYLSRGGSLTVIDHHKWCSDVVEALRRADAEIRVDTSAPAAALMVYEWLAERGIDVDDYDMKLVEMAIDDELFKNEVEVAVKWRRMLRWYDWGFRYRAVEALASGEMWPSWAEEAYRELSEKYEQALKKVVGGARTIILKQFRIVVADARSSELCKVHPGEVHQELESRFPGDIYVIVYPNGFSLRSTVVDVSKMAEALGGGGHRTAAGVPRAVSSVDELLGLLEKVIS